MQIFQGASWFGQSPPGPNGQKTDGAHIISGLWYWNVLDHISFANLGIFISGATTSIEVVTLKGGGP